MNADGYSNSTAIGNQAKITGNNIIQLGNGAVTKVFAGTGTTATLVAGGLQITGGTLAAGNVLTSDASGIATWAPPIASSNSWSLTGNSGTVDGTNFIGTTDNAPLNFKINNTASGRELIFHTTLYLVLVRGAPMALTIPSLGIVHLLKILEATLTQPLGPLLFIPIKKWRR